MSTGLTEHDERILSWLAGENAVPAPRVQPAPEPAPKAGRRRWPIFLMAAPAAVAIWSGWVALGAMCGFGYVHPLPGIWDSLQLDTAITLPVGVEAYGAYALGVWLDPGTPVLARRFACWSAIGSLALGALGQIAYHLLVHAGLHKAPVLVVVAVSCLPVIALGFGAALMHLLHQPDDPAAAAVPAAAPAVPAAPDAGDPEMAAAAALFAADILAGRLPGIRKIKKGLSVGQDKASHVREYLRGQIGDPHGA